MIARSTNQGVHFVNDVASNVGSSHGVILSGGSTGGSVTAYGDDANITLTVASKGSAAVKLGTATGSVQFIRPTAAVGSTAAAASLGNVGGADGPATQAQFGWLRVLDSSGGSQWTAVWR